MVVLLVVEGEEVSGTLRPLRPRAISVGLIFESLKSGLSASSNATEKENPLHPISFHSISASVSASVSVSVSVSASVSASASASVLEFIQH